MRAVLASLSLIPSSGFARGTSQESSAPKSLGARDFFNRRIESLTARTRGGWIPVTSTGMRKERWTPLYKASRRCTFKNW
ncbi:hypothetical protein CO666_02925 [Rhizobium chutanense]|uniref:Uncharacterized protein n=1 Tax=Rhizobium chutanense TaxID=2035448 RepID=A0A2A6JHS1_9HYPH|nr:hypothetical protein CO666_02925 [Rhizobium chutanense]